MSKGGFKIVSTLPKWVKDEKGTLDDVTAEMAIDILNRAQMNAPKDTGALVRSARVIKADGGGYTVQFGDSSVQYAYRRHFENNKNPQTLLYLEKAGDTVRKGNIKKYFR